MRYWIAAYVLMSFPAQALEYCEELWFTRNLMFDRAGHCFGSALGQAVFDNRGCDKAGASLDAAGQAMVARVREAEALEGCKVDTLKTSLPIPMIELRKTLIDPPFPSLYESACIGWNGDPIPLRSARRFDGAVIGEARQGDTLLFQFEDEGDWSFVEVTQDGMSVTMGWAQIIFEQASCDMAAG